LGVRRRGKYLLLDLSEGLLLMHLGMSGRLLFAPQLPAPGPHDHFELVTDQGVLRLHDPRRFGAVVYAPAQDAPVARNCWMVWGWSRCRLLSRCSSCMPVCAPAAHPSNKCAGGQSGGGCGQYLR